MHHNLNKRKNRPAWLRFVLPGGGPLYWLVLGTALLLASSRLIAEPLLRPVVSETLVSASKTFSRAFGVPVQFGYANLYLALSYRGIVILMTEPFAELGEDTFSAGQASLALYPGRKPLLTVSHIHLAVEDVAALAALAARPASSAQLQTLDQEGNLPAFNIVAEDISAQLNFAGGRLINLAGLQLATDIDPGVQILDISLRTEADAGLKLAGKATLALDATHQDMLFYLRATGLHGLLADLLPRQQGTGTLTAEIWGSYRGDKLDAKARLLGSDFSQDILLADGSAAPARLSGAFALLEADLQAVGVSTDGRRGAADWKAVLANAVLSLPEPYLGAPVSLARAEGSGTLRVDADGWQIQSDDVRVTGPLGTATGAVQAGKPAAGPLTLSLAASAPQLDAAALLGTLPLALGEKTVRFLRRDLQVGAAQLSTLVVDGSQFENFPWHDSDEGTFLLEGDFFGAQLDYANEWPPLTDARGGFGIDGNALAVTIAAAQLGPADIGLSRAGIDNLNATLSTLFVATGSALAQDDLIGLIGSLPATREHLDRFADLRIDGSQQLDLALNIPLDTDDPVLVDGALAMSPGSSLVYRPLTLTVSDIAGQVNFNERTLNGVALGRLLDTPARLSVGFDSGAAEIRVDGSFDLAAAAQQLQLADNLPLRGTSAVEIVIRDDGLALRSPLVGTAVDLPGPLGKAAAVQRWLELRSRQGRASIRYGDTLARMELAGGGLAVALGGAAEPGEPPVRGTVLRGQLGGVDLDNISTAGPADMSALPLPLDAQLTLADATFLGLKHPQLTAQATVAATVTVVALKSQALDGWFSYDAEQGVEVSLAHLTLPEEPEPPPAAETATIYVEPGRLSPALPKLAARVDRLSVGDRTYTDVRLAGHPTHSLWHLDSLSAGTDGGRLAASGFTHFQGAPLSQLALTVTIDELDIFLQSYGNEDAISEGAATMIGKVAWQGALHEPHYLSMQGTMSVSANDFVLRQSSGGVRLLNLLSPFTLLEALPVLGEQDSGVTAANGTLILKDGELIFEDASISSADYDIDISGSTNMITERNNIDSQVKIKATDNLATGAVIAFSPIVGALLLLANQATDQPLIKPLELSYHISGTWQDPIVEQKSADNADEQQ